VGFYSPYPEDAYAARATIVMRTGRKGREGGRENERSNKQNRARNTSSSSLILIEVLLFIHTHTRTLLCNADLKGNIPHWVFSKSVGTTGMHFLQTLGKLTKGKGK